MGGAIHTVPQAEGLGLGSFMDTRHMPGLIRGDVCTRHISAVVSDDVCIGIHRRHVNDDVCIGIHRCQT